MEENVFHRPEVLRELKEFVEVRLHTDVNENWSRDLLRIKNERNANDQTTPIYELIDPTTGKTIDKYLGADLSGKKFTEFLAKHTSKKPSRPGNRTFANSIPSKRESTEAPSRPEESRDAVEIDLKLDFNAKGKR